LDGYDLVISTSHCAAKSVVVTGRARHLCYCLTPMRYAWDQFDAYFGVDRVGRLGNALLRPVLAGLARWDRATQGRVHRYLAISQYVARRIALYYNRESTLVYPPVDTEFYRPDPVAPPTSHAKFLVVSALVPYKRVDLAMRAARQAGVGLIVVGNGPERANLERLAGDGIELLGWRTDEEIRDLYRHSIAAILPGEEDFARTRRRAGHGDRRRNRHPVRGADGRFARRGADACRADLVGSGTHSGACGNLFTSAVRP
jgi:glycosyltransferase involved in cell wall biosynthesis